MEISLILKEKLDKSKANNFNKSYIELIKTLGELAKNLDDKEKLKNEIAKMVDILIDLAKITGIKELKWRYKQKHSSNNLIKLTDRIASLGVLNLEKKTFKNNFANLFKSEVKKTLYTLADFAYENGVDFKECLKGN